MELTAHVAYGFRWVNCGGWVLYCSIFSGLTLPSLWFNIRSIYQNNSILNMHVSNTMDRDWLFSKGSFVISLWLLILFLSTGRQKADPHCFDDSEHFQRGRRLANLHWRCVKIEVHSLISGISRLLTDVLTDHPLYACVECDLRSKWQYTWSHPHPRRYPVLWIKQMPAWASQNIQWKILLLHLHSLLP